MRSSKLWLCVVLLFCFFGKVHAQSQEVQQLVLNVEKLSQLKGILSNMKKGYTVLTNGYNSVKNIAEGNFSLHEVFLDGLWLVSPEVRKYYKIADIIRYQSLLVAQYRSAFQRFSASGNFRPEDLEYVSKVYKRLFDSSLDNLDQLAMVITANKTRMSDSERLAAIDRIFADTEDQLTFLKSFNESAALLGLQRKQEKADIKGLGNYFNTP